MGLNPARGRIQLMTVRFTIAQNLSLLYFHRLDITDSVERDVKHQPVIINELL